jgi:hypothetical protein
LVWQTRQGNDVQIYQQEDEFLEADPQIRSYGYPETSCNLWEQGEGRAHPLGNVKLSSYLAD